MTVYYSLLFWICITAVAVRVAADNQPTTLSFNADTEAISSLYNSSWVTEEVEGVELRIEDIDFGSGRECALLIVFTYRHLFDEITNELLQCMCFGICPDKTDEEIEEILKDLKAEISRRQSGDDIPILVTYIAVLVVGLVGNVLVLITVLWIFKATSVTNLFICSLAVADLIVVTICIPFRILDYVGDEIWRLGAGACKFFVYTYFSSFMCSVFTLTAMSIERYMVICHPMTAASKSTPGRARKVILITWVAALVLAVPGAVTAGIADFECATAGFGMSQWRGPLYMYLTVAIFALPSILMGFSYASVAFALWRSVKAVRRLRNGGDAPADKLNEKSAETRARIQVIRMLVLVWVLFVITWGPDLFFNCIVSYWDSLYLGVSGRDATTMIQVFNLLTMANSAVNPVLYAFMSKQFRRGFAKVFLCVPCIRRRYKPDVPSAITGSTVTRRTSSVQSHNSGKTVSSITT